MSENLMSREDIHYKKFYLKLKASEMWNKSLHTKGKQMEKGSTGLLFTLVSGFEAHSTALQETPVDDSTV